MSSLQQTPAVGQVAPPAALIDGVSQQQIDAAVKAHVRGKKASKATELADLKKRINDLEEHLGDALEQLSLADEMFRQSSVLFGYIFSDLGEKATSGWVSKDFLEKSSLISDLGRRESDMWALAMRQAIAGLEVRA